MDEGKLIVEIGVAPVKPAEFVVFDQPVERRRGCGRVKERVSDAEANTLEPLTVLLSRRLDGVDIGAFKECSGVDSETEIIEYKERARGQAVSGSCPAR